MAPFAASRDSQDHPSVGRETLAARKYRRAIAADGSLISLAKSWAVNGDFDEGLDGLSDLGSDFADMVFPRFFGRK